MVRVVVAVISRLNQENQKEYLLCSTECETFGENSGAFYPPGGHIEPNETEEIALKREIQEEFGVDITPREKICETPADTPDQLICWWSCELESDDFQINKQEIANYGWYNKSYMQNIRLWPATKLFFENLPD